MSKQSLLLVDGDTRSLRVLEVSLRKAGFSVTPAVSVSDALEKLEVNAPDLIISETKFTTELDGFELRRRLRGMADWAEIPFIFLTAETAIENKIKGLELGVDDYLTKPIYIKEIVTRINILLQKRQRQFLDLRKDGTRFAGRVADMPVVDVIQTIEVSRKSGVIQFSGGPNRQAAIYFRDGKVIDAEAGTLQGEDAVYRLLTWNEGEFEVEFRTVRRREVIAMSSQGLLMEGMRRLDEWSRLLEQLPPLSHRFEIDAAELSGRLGEVPDDNNRILRLFDAKRTLIEVIDASDFGDLECLQAISRLYFEGLLTDLDPTQRTKRDTGKPGPLLVVEGGHGLTPMEKVASGPTDSGSTTSTTSDAYTTQRGMGYLGPRTDSDVPPVGGVTMGWDAQPDPTQAPAPATDHTAATAEPMAQPDHTAAPSGGVTMGWDAQPDPTAGDAQPDPIASAPVEAAAPAEEPRARRESSQLIEDGDVVAEEEVHAPLTGSYRPSSLRLIDEAVAAAQLIEPSLFDAEELAAAGVRPASPPASDENEPRATSEAAAIARVKLELRTSDPRIEIARDLVEKTPALAGDQPSNGRSRKKTVPPPIPRAPAKVSPKEISAKEVDEAPLLDSNLLTSGEHRIPSQNDLDDETPLLDSSLLTSGEHTIPTEAELAAAAAAATPPPAPQVRLAQPLGVVHVPLPDQGEPDDDDPAAAAEDEYSGVPTVIPAEEVDDDSAEVGGPTNLELPSPRAPSQKINREDSAAIRMIGSHGADRAEASGELKPPVQARASTEPGITQRELVTIMPRRKTGEVPQLRPEDIQAKQADKKSNGASTALPEDITADGKPGSRPKPPPKSDTAAKPDTKTTDDKVTADASSKPAVEPPSSPPRRVSVEGGVVAASRGPGRLASVLIALGSILAGVAVFSYCRKPKPAQQPVTTITEDAPTIVSATPDAVEYAFITDAAVAMQDPPDAAVAASVPADAAVVVVAPRDAGTVAVATADAGIDKNKEARILYDRAHAALEDGDPDQALTLLDQSLKLRRQAKTLLERARALQRMGRTDDALTSVEDAIKMNENYAPAWEQKGMILWSAQRYAEARPALEMYLQLDPEGRKAATIRSMLDEPR